MHHVPQILFCLNGIGNAYRFCTGIGNWEPTNVAECESYSVRYLAQQVPCACVQLELSMQVSVYAMASFILLGLDYIQNGIKFLGAQ